MIYLITGTPGAGKTSLLVSMLMSTFAGRRLYVTGIPELQVEHELLADPRKWHEPGIVEDGSLIVVDEAQNFWPKAANGAKVPPDLAAMNTHRHRGLDIVVISQGPHLLHANLKALVGRHIHLRDVGLLGRWWYEWPEVGEPARFKSAPIKKRYSLPKQTFGAYKSASLHVKPQRSIPRSVLLLGGALVLFGVLGWKGYDSISRKIHPPSAPVATPPAPGAAPAPMARPASGAATELARAPAPAPVVPAKPVVAGCMSAAGRCICYDGEGVQMTVETDVCVKSSREYSALVPLVGAYQPRRIVEAAARASAGGIEVAQAGGTAAPVSRGFDAGDYRARAPRTPVTMPGSSGL